MPLSRMISHWAYKDENALLLHVLPQDKSIKQPGTVFISIRPAKSSIYLSSPDKRESAGLRFYQIIPADSSFFSFRFQQYAFRHFFFMVVVPTFSDCDITKHRTDALYQFGVLCSEKTGPAPDGEGFTFSLAGIHMNESGSDYESCPPGKKTFRSSYLDAER